MNESEVIHKKNESNRLAKIWRSVSSLREFNLIIIIFAVGILMTFLSPNFLTASNLKATGIGLSSDGIVAIGMTIAIVSGGFDLSVGSVMALCGASTGILYLFGVNIWIACFLGIIIGAIVGVINGLFIGRVGLNPFITTLAMMGIARGVAEVITQGSPISLSGVPDSFSYIGQGSIAGIPFFIILFVVLAVIADFLMRRSEPLRKVFYIGSNEKAAILSGINSRKVKMYVFVTTGVLAAVAGIACTSRFSVADPTLGTSAEMRAISAAVIGGASLSGGEGSIFGTALGVILLNMINDGLVLLNVSVNWQDLVLGLILITAVTLDYISHQRKLNSLKVQSKTA